MSTQDFDEVAAGSLEPRAPSPDRRRSSKKRDALNALFQTCREAGDYRFDNGMVRSICRQHGFGNPFDVTKVDRSVLLPEAIRNAGYCVAHLGGGKRCFMPVLDSWYHKFEPIENGEKHEWQYRPSILNNTDTSESNIISLAYNQRILQDFVYEGSGRGSDPNIYMSRKTFITGTYRAGRETVSVKKQQMEIDATFELNGRVTAMEAKNGFHDDFSVYQIFLPFLKYHKSGIPGIRSVDCCYLTQSKGAGSNTVRLYLYTFSDAGSIDSIRLVKKAEYSLRERAA